MIPISVFPVSSYIGGKLIRGKLTRSLIDFYVRKKIKSSVLENDDPCFSDVTKEYQALAFWAMYKSILRNFDKNLISPIVLQKIVQVFLNNVLLSSSSKEARENFEKKYGMRPPTFFTISPTKLCNLHCEGCYAASSFQTKNIMKWDLLNRVIADGHDNLGMRFFVISGGEPLMYNDEGKTILDLVEKWNDSYFLMYTNGTLINLQVAKRMAQLGNITPAISLEGLEKETNDRRGRDVFDKILKAKDYLIQEGIPFGFSITATSKNINLLLQMDFYDKLYEELGATYLWIFQYMPIGRNFSKDLMLTCEQRVELFRIQEKLLLEKNYFLADFWNSAPMSNGCISCGRSGGYFYINWDGNIMPCVFIPYYTDNIEDLYSQGKKLEDALFSPLFKKGRDWQHRYIGLKDNPGNLIRPCFYRDHYEDFYKIAKEVGVKAENDDAVKALDTQEYKEFMTKYGKNLAQLTDPIWKEMVEKVKKESLN
ncbi:MAG: radical SAM protein [Bacteroidales bacterium]|nr:radical SAM protein [Bacteroidales bacterium]